MSKTLTAEQFRVKDLSLAEYGRHQIRLAEAEMPGLMALREEFGPQLVMLNWIFDLWIFARWGSVGPLDKLTIGVHVE